MGDRKKEISKLPLVMTVAQIILEKVNSWRSSALKKYEPGIAQAESPEEGKGKKGKGDPIRSNDLINRSVELLYN